MRYLNNNDLDDIYKKQNIKYIKKYYKTLTCRSFYIRFSIKLHSIFKKPLKKTLFLKGQKSLLGKSIICDDETHNLIRNIIKHNRPTLVARFGSTEATFFSNYIFEKILNIKLDKKYLDNLVLYSGFFPSNDNSIVDLFCKEFSKTINNVDLLGYWRTGNQEMLIDLFGNNNVRLSDLLSLDPWSNENPWSVALKGKKVVVVHPFIKTIRSQYKKREKIWAGTKSNILPEFSLRCVEAVQTIGGNIDSRFSNWFQALDYMEQECFKEDFDVAIIGCGAYGMFLGSRIKNRGKIAIHLGGNTQLLFGIKGKRWDNNKYYSRFFNDNWVRPREEEKPPLFNKIEDGCYW